MSTINPLLLKQLEIKSENIKSLVNVELKNVFQSSTVRYFPNELLKVIDSFIFIGSETFYLCDDDMDVNEDKVIDLLNQQVDEKVPLHPRLFYFEDIPKYWWFGSSRLNLGISGFGLAVEKLIQADKQRNINSIIYFSKCNYLPPIIRNKKKYVDLNYNHVFYQD